VRQGSGAVYIAAQPPSSVDESAGRQAGLVIAGITAALPGLLLARATESHAT